MRRLLLAVLGLVAGITLLLSLKSAPGATRLPEQVPPEQRAAPPGIAASATPGTAGPPPPGTAGSPPTGTAGSPPAGGSEPGPSPPPNGGSGSPPNGRTYTGDSAYTEFGYVTVQITVSDGRITDVAAVEMPADQARSAALSDRVAPILRERALAAQSASFDTVSGATWTSEAYQQSLTSALVKAGIA